MINNGKQIVAGQRNCIQRTVVSPTAYPFVCFNNRCTTTVYEIAQNQNISDSVCAAEGAVRQRSYMILKQPKTNFGISVLSKAVTEKINIVSIQCGSAMKNIIF